MRIVTVTRVLCLMLLLRTLVLHAQWHSTCSAKDADITAKEFIKVLRWGRVVILQDCALLQEEYGGAAVFKHPVFAHASWCAFLPVRTGSASV